MKGFTRALALMLIFCALLSFCGCDLAAVLGGTPSGEFSPTPIEDVVKDSFENTYRDQLNANEAAIFDAVAYAAPGENVFTVTLPEPLALCRGRVPTEEEKQASLDRITFWAVNALYAVWLDSPSLFWLETGNFKHSYKIEAGSDAVYRISTVTLTVEKRENAENAVAYAEALRAKLSSLSLRGKSDAETVRAINDYLCNSIRYEDCSDRQNVYGALLGGRCVCEGYSHAFKLLCDAYGITSVSIVGTGISDAGGEAHMWNAVRIDGAWYAVDVTWNDVEAADAKNAFLLVGGETKSFGRTFRESHVVTQTRGNSKTFATVFLNEKTYVPK